MLHRLSLLPLVLALGACAPSSAPADSAAETAASATAAADPAQAGYPDMDAPSREVDPAAMAPAAPRSMRGGYVFGHEVETFQECGGSADWWADGDEAVLAPLRRLALQQAEATGEPYRPIYVEATGELLGKDEDAGFASDFDNVVKLSVVTATRAEVPADCALPTH